MKNTLRWAGGESLEGDDLELNPEINREPMELFEDGDNKAMMCNTCEKEAAAVYTCWDVES